MNIWILLGLICFLPLALLAAWLILSTCMGDSFRARVAGVPVNVRQANYGKTYARNLPNFGSGLNQGGFEQIELENMMDPEEEFEARPEVDDYGFGDSRSFLQR
jgi:hypothetical protein